MIDPAVGNAESHFLTADDGVRLHYLHWRSGRSPPSAVVVFLHGIASHAGWFTETAAALNRQGVEVYGLDRRGSGRSGGPSGHLDRYERALDDVEQFVRLVASEHSGTPIFLAGSSWAAKFAVVYAAQRAAPLSGLLLLGPVLLPRVNLSPWSRVRVVAGHLVHPMARLPIPLTPELYTANPPYRDYIRSDPLRLLEATTQFFWQTARLDRRRRRDSARLALPVLLLQGDGDGQRVRPIMNELLQGAGLVAVAEDKVLVTGLKGPLERGWQQKVAAFAARIPLQGQGADNGQEPARAVPPTR
jgi:alpha-beta hydrolase superfamily lysophospholipase